ncbi:replication-associated protein [Lolium perenne-associated virus]|uniref:replication-associated protein n=1 Tax=Lolium perenne-associated virus TaxID=2282644 RepID=UPI000DF5D482|nr:replication-associated protein [Lolium perenne-associated virus]AXF50879.1 replication-associated protein [Lolium perenne-associated virus]
MSFRLQSKILLLTYSQADAIDHERLFKFLSGLKQPIRIRVGKEAHMDGHTHYHAYAEWEKKYETTDARHFDFESIHPNIVSRVRDPLSAWNYCGKDGVAIDYGECPQPRAINKRKQMMDAFDASSRQEFMEMIKNADPGRYIFQHQNLEYFANKQFAVCIPQYVSDPDLIFNIPDELTTWLSQRHEADRPKSLILTGPSRTGKTKWARSLGRHIYWNGAFDLSIFDNDAQYAIFDDFPDWDRFVQYKQWLGAQQHFTATDKYMKKTQIKWGKPCIILSNQNPLFKDYLWIKENTIECEIKTKLY